jgi:hypothetical protein
VVFRIGGDDYVHAHTHDPALAKKYRMEADECWG